MPKGSYPGGGTVIGARDVAWFGHGGVASGPREDVDQIAQRRSNPLTAEAERRISNLRVDVAGLKRAVLRLDQERGAAADQLSRSQRDLAALLLKHGLPLDPHLPTPGDHKQAVAPVSGKTTRHQRRNEHG